MTDSAADIAAYIGALSWVPQIVGWIVRAVAKPTLRFRVGGNLQVGHGGLGMVIGLNVAVSSEGKDALIDRIRATLIHEKGDRRELEWYVATENQTEMRNDSGERIQMSRTQSVLALKVTTQSLAERFIGFIDESAQRPILAGQQAATSEWISQRSEGAVDWNAFVLRPVAQAVRVELERAFHWQEGHYTLELRLSVVGSRGDHVERFEFSLPRAEVERIRGNLALWGENLSAVIGGGGFPTWSWSYPSLSRR